jgi:hypothetical protein
VYEKSQIEGCKKRAYQDGLYVDALRWSCCSDMAASSPRSFHGWRREPIVLGWLDVASSLGSSSLPRS